MTNLYKGDVEFKAGDRTFVLRPTWEAIAEIEAMLGEGFFTTANRIQALAKFGLRDLAVIIHAGVKAAGSPLKFEDVGRLVADYGVVNAIGPVNEFIQSVMQGPKSPDPTKGKAGQSQDST